MKNNRNGQAEVLNDEQLFELLEEMEPKHKLLFAVCYFTSCRISEALKLERSDVKGGCIVFRSKNTKTGDTREVRINPKLQAIINNVGLPESGYLFPGKKGGHLTRQAADAALRKACNFCGFEGVSTHSFRRTGITKLHNAGVPLKVIQKHTGHKDLDSLVLYIEISDQEVATAVNLL